MSGRDATNDDSYDAAVDVVLNSGILTETQMAMFWQCVNGAMTAEQFRDQL